MIFALAIFLFTGIANAEFIDTDSGWARLVDNNTSINSNFEGITAFFEAESYSGDAEDDGDRDRDHGRMTTRTPYFKETAGTPRVSFSDATFSTWANIRVLESGLQVLDGEFEVYGSLELNGVVNEGLAFSASLIDVEWNDYTIAFLMETDQHGYLCDLGFCSLANEVLRFNLTSALFDGDFAQDFDFGAQTVATVPTPAAILLFGTAIMGLGGLRRSNKAVEIAVS